MGLDTLADFLLWCLILNLDPLALYFVLMLAAGNWVYRTHSRWFALSRETLDAIHYCFKPAFKTAIIFFNLVPWVVIQIVR